MTAARLLAAQGHVTSAREVLGALLERAPGDAQAAALARELGGLPDRAEWAEPPDEPLAPPQRGDPAALASAFRAGLARPAAGRPHGAKIDRLRALLGHIQKARGESAR